MERLGRLIGSVFGTIMITLSVLITIETIVRKLFSVTLGGVDELSGYAIAIGAPLAFAVACIEQSQIRINLLYSKMPKLLQAACNLLSALSLSALAIFFLVYSYQTLQQTIGYHALAQTPWATPLVYPQSIWFAAIAIFALITIWIALRAIGLMFRGRMGKMINSYGPEKVEDELEAEMRDLLERQS